jgi:3-phosphoglycerate kinase
MNYLSKIKKERLNGKTCLLRLDLNIQDNELNNSLRLERAVPTILYLIKNHCKVVIISHKGRPNLAKQGISKSEFLISNKELSLRKASDKLSNLIGQKIVFIEEFNFKKISTEIKNGLVGEVFMLENLRFNKGEETNSRDFSKKIASLGEIYINDAFAVSHRKDASVVAITRYLSSCAGLEMESELDAFSKVINQSKKPLTLVLGGIKIDDKIGVIKKFYNKADWVLTGGGVANTFFAAKNIPVGKSVYDKKSLSLGKKWISFKKIILPQDLVIEDGEILDIGKHTVNFYSEIIKKSKTIIWNGPMGYIEDEKFRSGTVGIIEALKKSKAYSVVGGGETASLILRLGLQKNVSFLSVGGGAMLEFLAGNKLPGIEALKKSRKI